MGNAEVYYFSGTGNSYAVAGDIAERINGKLISIASVSGKETIRIGSDITGIVFPVYFGSNDIHIPLIVNRFISKLENVESRYIFSVCTFGGGIDTALEKVNSLLKAKGGKLSAGFGVHMPQNAFKKPFDFRMIKFRKWEKKRDRISEIIKNKKCSAFEKNSLCFNLIKRFFELFVNLPRAEKRGVAKCAGLSEDLPFDKLILSTDNSYSADEKCSGCGICEKVCPVDNIKMTDNKPAWQNHCENCLACFNWCPQHAVTGGIPGRYHYLNPYVSISGFIKQDEG